MAAISDLGRPAWAEIDLLSLAMNVREFKRILPAHVRIMAVIKADGYGHGAYEVSRAALQEGATMLGAASFEEGLDLRRRGITAPILILGYTDINKYDSVIENDLTATVFQWEAALALAEMARARGKTAPVHIKLDTGMGRLGLRDPAEILLFLRKLSALEGIQIEGLFTHFATADELENSYMQEQLQTFREICEESGKMGLHIPLRHAANSAAAAFSPKTFFDMVRIGIGMYGYLPAHLIPAEKLKLSPVLSLKTKVIYLKKIPAGASVSYGRTFTAPGEMLVATVPLGYGDGYSRQLSNRGFMLIRGCKAPVIGRVCMDLTMLDVSNVPGVREGDEAVAYGKQGAREVSVEQTAQQLGTISYEILCNINSRIPRIYQKVPLTRQ